MFVGAHIRLPNEHAMAHARGTNSGASTELEDKNPDRVFEILWHLLNAFESRQLAIICLQRRLIKVSEIAIWRV